MEHEYCGLTVVIGLTVVAVFASGCTTSGINRINETSVPFQLVPSEGVYVSGVQAYEDGEELVICGSVKRGSQNCCDPARGRVDIPVIAPDGLVLDRVSTFYSPRNIPKVRSRSSRFAVRLPYTLPDGVIVRIAHRSSLTAVDSAIW